MVRSNVLYSHTIFYKIPKGAYGQDQIALEIENHTMKGESIYLEIIRVRIIAKLLRIICLENVSTLETLTNNNPQAECSEGEDPTVC